ncbi:S8 family serine peptidase [Brunnivagina elsteri]|uniref:Peptidase S8 and S53 subtilisin kexin sedolisin n=1 Tax=Brunnivagina elsteri CCALA 953 TaxID=987040 RepID=A0A2A2TEQ4_9CYAN|nr:S8 family serine peptidase [Calothrix elsteri]PAX52193.1 peptidase S8 and S53 subtilisin kexin sedolisin [Calothrix elsteri CCALA 953]
MPANVPGNSLSTALDINISNGSQVFTDTTDSLGSSKFYSFGLQGRSSFNLSLRELGGNFNVDLIQDKNANGVFDSDEVVAVSQQTRRGERLNTDIDGGNYYIRVYGQGDNFGTYSLTVSAISYDDFINQPISASPSDLPIAQNRSRRGGQEDRLASIPSENQPVSQPASQNTSTKTWKQGTLGADVLVYDRTNQTTFVSGNGNINFGTGGRDILDFKTIGISSTQATFNWATATAGGVVDNPGNGYRLFDAIILNDGKQVLFESIEQILFADTTYDLTVANPGIGIGTQATVTTNDTNFSQQWDLHITGVHNAWRFTTGSAGVLIGIEDSGLAVDSNGVTHPDLRSTIFSESNYLDESTGASHGTVVQSTIAAASNNGFGIAGINWNSDVMHIDVLGNTINGTYQADAGDFNLVNATQTLINQANSKGQKLIVNLSLIGGSSDAFQQLIANNQDKALFVIAAGNDDVGEVSSPGSFAQTYGNVISVGASWGNKDWYGNSKNPGERVSYANPKWWGSNYTSDTAINAGLRPLTLMTPTEFPAASADKNSTGSFNFGYNDKFNGTSASTAIASGIASLVWSANTSLSASQIRAILSETAYDLGTTGYDKFYGNGFVNADAAVRRALAIARNYS